jgi:hypothetical protein
MKWLMILGFVLGGFETATAREVIRCEVNIIDARSGYVLTRLLDRGRDCDWAFDSCYRTIDYNRLDAVCEEVPVGPIGPQYPSYPHYPTYYPNPYPGRPTYPSYPTTTVTVTTQPSVTVTETVEEWVEEVPSRHSRSRRSTNTRPSTPRPTTRPTTRPSTPAPRPSTPAPAPRPSENTGRAPAPGSRGETLPPPPRVVGGRN